MNKYGALFAAWPGLKNISRLLLARGVEQEKLAADLTELDARMSLLFTLELIDQMTESPLARKRFEKLVREFDAGINR